MTEISRTAVIANMLDNLQRMGEMYVFDYGYLAVVNYILGINQAGWQRDKTKELDGFQQFVADKVGGDCATIWPIIIRKMLADGDDDKALSIFYELLREFLHKPQDPISEEPASTDLRGTPAP